jgi:hypothetical protein
VVAASALAYYGDDRATTDTFRATLANDASGRQFLRTGDLGLFRRRRRVCSSPVD